MSKSPDYGIDAIDLAMVFLAGGIGAFVLAVLIREFTSGLLMVGALKGLTSG